MDKNGKKYIAVDRLLTTESASVFLPFDSYELRHKKGVYYGLNSRSKNLIIYDRTEGKNPSGVIFGKLGAGMSFSAKREIVQGGCNYKLFIDSRNGKAVGKIKR